MADELSRRHALLFMAKTKILGFELFKELYDDNDDFGEIYKNCKKRAFKDFYKHDDLLFKGTKLYVPKASMRELFVKETREWGLMRHSRVQKTLDILHDNFF